MGIVASLALLYSAIILINIGVIALLWRGTRSPHYRALMRAWVMVLISAIAIGATSNRPGPAPLVGFAVCVVEYLAFGLLLADMVGLQIRRPLRLFIGAEVLALVAGIVLERSGQSLSVAMIPVATAAGAPAVYIGLWVILRRWKALSLPLQGFAITLLLHGLHAWDYPIAIRSPELVVAGTVL